MSIPLINLKRNYQSLQPEIMQAISDVLDSGRYVLGPRVGELEAKVANLSGVEHGVGLANGTDALVLALRALGVGPGDEVITSPFTFFASAECISLLGATPVFADIDPGTFNIDAETIAQCITPRTKGIIPVHIFGQPCNMEPILQLAAERGLWVLEDACQAIGASYGGKPVGSFGIAACYSFFPTKNLGGYGDGGMLVTDDQGLAEQVRLLRAHGSSKKYYHEEVGYNSRLDELQAAILNIKLQSLDKWTRRRQQLAQGYDRELGELVATPYVLPDCQSVYHLYVIGTDRRDELQAWLQQRGIGSGVYYPLPLHLQKVYQHLGYRPGDLPAAEAACKQVLALPCCPDLTEDEQTHIVKEVKNFFQGGK